jgi:hypothetical protein
MRPHLRFTQPNVQELYRWGYILKDYSICNDKLAERCLQRLRVSSIGN